MKLINPYHLIKKINHFLNAYKTNSIKIDNHINYSNQEFKNINKKMEEISELIIDSNKNYNHSLKKQKDSNKKNFIELNEKIENNTNEISLLNDKINNNFIKTKSFLKEWKKYYFKTYENELNENTDIDQLFKLGMFAGIDFLTYSKYENKFLLKTKENIILATITVL